jgi:hypothetical protein
VEVSVKKLISALGLLVFCASLAQAGAPPDGHSTEGVGKNGRNLFPPKQPDPSVTDRPAMVEYLEPKALATVGAGNVTLKWKEVAGADSYRVQIATDGNFKWIVGNADFVKDTSFEATGLESGKNYFWRVYAWKTTNMPGYTSSYAKFSSFSVK